MSLWISGPDGPAPGLMAYESDMFSCFSMIQQQCSSQTNDVTLFQQTRTKHFDDKRNADGDCGNHMDGFVYMKAFLFPNMTFDVPGRWGGARSALRKQNLKSLIMYGSYMDNAQISTDKADSSWIGGLVEKGPDRFRFVFTSISL